jgi:glutathione S-transferase
MTPEIKPEMKLIIGNKKLSSWSLRPWLLMTHFGIPFEEILIPLDKRETRESILQYSPSAKVPALIDGDLIIWESLAIAEYIAEKFPEKKMWPGDMAQRARARAISSEMAASFQTMRTLMPHDLSLEHKTFDSSKAEGDITRVKSIWTECLGRHKGRFLFGDFSIADAMFAPVVNRFISYAVPMEGPVATYARTMRALPAHQAWIKAGLTENF